MHPVVGSVVRLDRQECAGADMQRHRVNADAARETRFIRSGVKCKPAVGAATEPSWRANMVW